MIALERHGSQWLIRDRHRRSPSIIVYRPTRRRKPVLRVNRYMGEAQGFALWLPGGWLAWVTLRQPSAAASDRARAENDAFLRRFRGAESGGSEP